MSCVFSIKSKYISSANLNILRNFSRLLLSFWWNYLSLCRSASPALKTVYLIVVLDAAGLIAGMGGQDILRRYLTFFFWTQNLAILYREEETATRMSRHDDDSVTAHSVWELLHIIPDVGWLRCLFWLIGSPRPEFGISIGGTPTSFLYPFCKGVAGHRHYYDESSLS